MPSKRLKLTHEMVASAKETLDAIPSAPRELRPTTVSEAIRTLTPTIRRLLEKGHSREAVLGFLKEQGIECSPSTFKECYRPGRAKTAGKAAECGGASPAPMVGHASGKDGAGSGGSATPVLPLAQPPVQAPAARSPLAKLASDSRPEQQPNAGHLAGAAKAS